MNDGLLVDLASKTVTKVYEGDAHFNCQSQSALIAEGKVFSLIQMQNGDKSRTLVAALYDHQSRSIDFQETLCYLWQ